MKTELKKLAHSQIELTLHVPHATYLTAEKKALAEINKQLKLPGLRPGHIPETIVRENVSPQNIRATALDQLLPLALTQAIQEHKLQIIARPKVEIKKHAEKEGDDLILVALVEVMPEVKLADHSKIKIKKKPLKVEEKQVEETLGMIMDRFAVWKDVEREAKMKDRVEVDFEGFDENDQPIENTKSKNHPVILGTQSLIPGFEEELVGLKVGDEKTFAITFPKDYHAKAMQARKVTFKVKLGRLEEKEEQQLDEAMVEKITGEKQSPELFRKSVEEDLKAEMEHRLQNEHDQAVLDALAKITLVELPETLIHDAIDEIREEKKNQISRQGLKWEQYLNYMKKTEEDFEKEHREDAEYRLKVRMGIQALIKALDLNISDEEAEQEIEKRSLKVAEEKRGEFKKYYQKGSEAYLNLKNSLLIEKLITHFTEQ